ncbi:(2Fe-2S)-binding protein [bacterium]|nr:MAG: (2Fe-2S)-binding protein [bacterium]
MRKNSIFIINNITYSSSLHGGITILEYLRKHLHLTGVKEGCREGDCGACLILLGELVGSNVIYKQVNSCLIPLGDADGKHIVTIEGLNHEITNTIQELFVDETATQCGFCTPGFIVSLTGYLLNNTSYTYPDAVSSMDGNICRCTGHYPIKKVAAKLTEKYKGSGSGNKVEYLINNNFIPSYFRIIPSALKKISKPPRKNIPSPGGIVVSGGTDLYVQKWDSLQENDVTLIYENPLLKGIRKSGKKISIGGVVTVEELKSSKIISSIFTEFPRFLTLFASTPIRNRATVAGNIVNASPIGDLTNIFLALDSSVKLINSKGKIRSVKLNKFFKNYKVLEKKKNEYVLEINFKIPEANYFFNFEKVSRRTYLDIATVNSSALFILNNGIIVSANISAGGVAPVPRYLEKTCSFLKGKELTGDVVRQSVVIARNEISPIDDVRGSAEYKRLLLGQLIYSHFLKINSEIIKPESIL